MGTHEETWGAETTVHPTGATRGWRWTLLTLSAAMLLLGLGWWLREPMHGIPLERDEGAYATIAARWLAGDALYRDLFDHKPPLVYLVFALARLLPGGPIHQIRELATLYLLASGLIVLALGWRLYGGWGALAGLALFLAYGSSLSFQGLIFNSEAVLLLPATAGCLLAALGMQARRPVLLGLAGVCVGLAIAAKPVGAALLAPLALGPFLRPIPLAPRPGRSQAPAPPSIPWSEAAGWRLRAVLCALAGALLPLALLALVLWRQGALPATYQALVIYNQLYAAASVEQGWDAAYLWRIWAPMLALALPALVGLASMLCGPAWRTPEQILSALWGLALLATALLSLRAYPHYYLAAVPFLSIWAGAAIALIASTTLDNQTAGSYHEGTQTRGHPKAVYFPFVSSRLLGARADLIGPLAALAVLVGLLAPPIADIWPLRAQTPYEQIGRLYGPDGYAYFGHADKVAAYIAERVPPDQPIFVWAAEPEIYYLSGRRPAARFVYDYPVEHLPGGRDELLGALRRALPPLIITYHDVRPLGFHPFMPEHGYQLRATIGGFDVYERGED